MVMLYTPRLRLGLSQVGNPCSRLLWLYHNGYVPTPPPQRMLRLFDLGNRIEQQIIDDLGTVENQQRQVSLKWGSIELTGSIDGELHGMLLEIKSANQKNFDKLLKLKSYEQWNLKYKAQVQVYMLAGEQAEAVVKVYNKNTSEIYTERIKHDNEYAIGLMEKVFNTLSRPDFPEPYCSGADTFIAKYCEFRNICHGN